MSINVERLSSDESDRWSRAVERSSQTTPFHQYEALRQMARTKDKELALLAGFRGQEPVGLLPVFRYNRGPLTLVRSPLLAVGIRNIGPALVNHEKLKQRKREMTNRQFVDGALDWLRENYDPDHVEFKTTHRYADVRPFIWNDFDVETNYTYILDLPGDRDELLQQFSKSTRRNIRNRDPDAYSIHEAGEEGIRKIHYHIKRRYEQSDVEYVGTPLELKLGLYESLPEGQVRPYVCEVDGEYASGIIALEYGDTAYFWRGGAKNDANVPVNTYLHWHVMCEAMNRGLDRYHIMGATNERVSKYKSKFGPRLKPEYTLRSQTTRMQAATELHAAVSKGVEAIVQS